MAVVWQLQRSKVVKERIEWLKSIGVSPKAIRAAQLDRHLDDLTFRVVINEMLRDRAIEKGATSEES